MTSEEGRLGRSPPFAAPPARAAPQPARELPPSCFRGFADFDDGKLALASLTRARVRRNGCQSSSVVGSRPFSNLNALGPSTHGRCRCATACHDLRLRSHPRRSPTARHCACLCPTASRGRRRIHRRCCCADCCAGHCCADCCACAFGAQRHHQCPVHWPWCRP
eukprot:scaffold31898_cov60-Phaeocystis_antarctica.AAC.4